MSLYLGTTPIADGASTALLAGKADTNLGNAIISSTFATKLNSAGIRTVVETYKNGASWYRVYSDGWCEQGGWVKSGVTSVNSGVVVTFLKPYKDTNYTIVIGSSHADTSNNTISVSYGNFYYGCYYAGSKSTTSIRLTMQGTWYACGY